MGSNDDFVSPEISPRTEVTGAVPVEDSVSSKLSGSEKKYNFCRHGVSISWRQVIAYVTPSTG